MADSCSVDRVPVRRYIVRAERHEIATTQLAVDRKIEHCEVARAALQLQLGPTTRAPRNGGFGRGVAICDEGLLRA